MKNRSKRQALAAAAKIVDALKAGGAVAGGAQVEVRVCGHKQKTKKRESRPRGKKAK